MTEVSRRNSFDGSDWMIRVICQSPAHGAGKGPLVATCATTADPERWAVTGTGVTRTVLRGDAVVIEPVDLQDDFYRDPGLRTIYRIECGCGVSASTGEYQLARVLEGMRINRVKLLPLRFIGG